MTALKVTENQISKRDRSGLADPYSGGAAGEVSGIQLDREGRVMRPGVPATGMVGVIYRLRLSEQATIFGVRSPACSTHTAYEHA